MQFANIVINYDLPWNPMKIEQRIGRVDRIGQKQDVYIYNFMIGDTIENRVRTVLENKLSIILSETGIDKLADVLDNEMADIDFTQIYINSIRNPKDIDHNISNIEDDLRKQIIKANEYKELFREDKELELGIDYNMEFELEKSLYNMLNSYNFWKYNDLTIMDNININDEEVTRHLDQERYWSKDEIVPSILIKDFPNEKGYFSLWELSINDDLYCKRILPIFITNDMIFKPFSGKRIWDELLKLDTSINVTDNTVIESNVVNGISRIAQDAVYDNFLELKSEYEDKNEEMYRKYSYALNLRIEAARKIGIENIKNFRLNALAKEREEIIQEYERNKNICPVFKPIFMSRLE